MSKKVLMIGPVPPPAGGVSIHISRLSHLLGSYFQINFVDESRVPKPGTFNLREYKLGEYLKRIRSSDLVHIHSGTRSLKYFHIFWAKLLRRRVVLTIHSYRTTSRLRQKIDRMVYGMPDVTIAVGPHIQQILQLKNRVLVKEAFLPPVLEKEPPVPKEILQWIEEKRRAGYAVASGNAWRLSSMNGVDLYGLDLCIDAAIELRKQNRKCCFVYAVSDPNGDINIVDYEQKIADNNLQDIFYLRKSALSFVQLIQHSDIILRPTFTDGDALTVREGIYFNRPVIASDVVQRPEGTVLFKNRDLDSYVDAFKRVLDDPDLTNKKERPLAGPQLAEFYKEIYESLL